MRVVAMLAGGALYALALPPFDWAPAAWLVLVPPLLALRGVDCRTAFRYGCLFGYAAGWSVLWPLVDAGTRYLAVSYPLAVVGSCLWFLTVVGLPFGVFAAGSALLLRTGRSMHVLLGIPALWVASEFLRGHVLGQPWGLLGYTQHHAVGLIQIAAWTGVYGVSFLVALGSAGLALAARKVSTEGIRAGLPALALPALAIAATWLTGQLFLEDAAVERFGPVAASRDVAIVQTAISPSRQWSRAYTATQVAAHLHATETIGASESPALIVWPEYAVPDFLEADPGLAAVLSQAARRHHADLLFGVPRRANGRSFNSVRLITAAGRNGGYYDKRRLVLFAEQEPFGGIVRRPDTNGMQAFASGTEPGVFQSFVRLGVSICHEAIHPDLIADTVRHGAELLINVANDSWIEGSSPAAGEQHLAMTTFRAVETRRYLVRAALTGTSAIIDPFGRVEAALPPGRAGVLNADVVGLSAMTWYVRLGDAFAWTCLAVAALMLAAARRHDRAPIHA